MAKYSQGIMADGPVILLNGRPMTPEQIVSQLNRYDKSLTTAKQAWAEHYERYNGVPIDEDTGGEAGEYTRCY